MKILALEIESTQKTQKDINDYLMEEARAAWDLLQQGVIREIYFHAEDHTAVIMLEAGSEMEAAKTLDQLPLVREGFISFKLIPLTPYDGFARLFH